MKTLAISFFLISIAVVACAGHPEPVQPTDSPRVVELAPSPISPTPQLTATRAAASTGEARPTKGAAADLLVKLCTAVEKHDVDTILGCWRTFPEISEAQVRQMFARENAIEIDREALDKLIKLGEWGPISEVYPSSGANLSNLLGYWKLDASQCWALRLAPAEVALHWDGKVFQVIECDDLHKPRLLRARER